MRRYVSLFVCAVLLCVLIPSPAAAQIPRPSLGFWPGFRFLPVGQIAEIQVRASAVVNLYGCEVEVRYDPAALEVQDADPNTDGIQVVVGEVFGGRTAFVALNEVDAGAGVIRFAATLLEPASPIQGSATLMRVRFKALAPGPTMLRFGRVILVDVGTHVIDARLVDGGMWLGPIR